MGFMCVRCISLIRDNNQFQSKTFIKEILCKKDGHYMFSCTTFSRQRDFDYLHS